MSSVTGRYPIYNLGYFHKEALRKLNNGCAFYCDVKNHNLFQIMGLDWCGHSFETRLWGSTVDFYNRFVAMEYANCNDYDGRMVEQVLFDKLKSYTHGFKALSSRDINKRKEYIAVRFRREPIFGGLEGSEVQAVSFSKNQTSAKSRIKRIICNAFRTCLPFMKF